MELNLVIILGIIFIALVTETVVKALRGLFPCKLKSPIPQIMSLAVSVLLCVSAHLDIFVAFGYTLSLHPLGAVITGIIASLGAGGIFDLYTKMNEYKEKLAVEKHNSAK